MNTPGRHHFLIIKYLKVNDIRQDIIYNLSVSQSLSDTDLTSQVQLSWT